MVGIYFSLRFGMMTFKSPKCLEVSISDSSPLYHVINNDVLHVQVYGGLRWAQELRQRLEVPMGSFKHVEHPCMQSLDAKKMFTKYEEMLKLLSE